MKKITKIKAREILDSRQKPTIEVELFLDNETSFIASVPSGASTGKNEAVELRDEDGVGVLKAIQNINEIIAPKLIGKNPTKQQDIDELLIRLDGTENKSKLGANAILPVSIAVCRAGAATENLPLYEYISKASGFKLQASGFRIPFPMFNVINGGAHARRTLTEEWVQKTPIEGGVKLDIQEFMLVFQEKTFEENFKLQEIISNNLRNILIKKLGGNLLMGDEGGFVLPTDKTKEALNFLKEAIGDNNVAIALDCAASEFYFERSEKQGSRRGSYEAGKYTLESKEFSKEELQNFYRDLVSEFNIISLEDPFAQDDFQKFTEITKALPKTIIVGDDLTTTNINKIKEAQEKKMCNGVIIKPNQIGTVSETIEAVKLAKSYSWKIIASHRSGETMDDFIADFSVGVGADFIKAGAYTQKERMVKYDRLLVIEREIN